MFNGESNNRLDVPNNHSGSENSVDDSFQTVDDIDADQNKESDDAVPKNDDNNIKIVVDKVEPDHAGSNDDNAENNNDDNAGNQLAQDEKLAKNIQNQSKETPRGPPVESNSSDQQDSNTSTDSTDQSEFKSIARLNSLEVEPRLSNFEHPENENVHRPSLKTMLKPDTDVSTECEDDNQSDTSSNSDDSSSSDDSEHKTGLGNYEDPSSVDSYSDEDESGNVKYDMFDGVTGKSLLEMFGVIMFLRFGYIVANAGILQTTIIIVICGFIAFGTTISISTICTNGKISKGGPYYLISRSLGPSFGIVIAFLYAAGSCIDVALNLTGFAEFLVLSYGSNDNYILSSQYWDTVLFGQVGLLLLFAVAMGGIHFVMQSNSILLLFNFLGTAAFIFGALVIESNYDQYGYTAPSIDTFNKNWESSYLKNQSFMTMLALFFPSITGILAGVNLAERLKYPSKHIPKGTVIAIISATLLYLLQAYVLGFGFVRETGTDGVGLYHDFLIMTKISLFSPMVSIAIFASAFSRAAGRFITAVSTMTAVSNDKLLFTKKISTFFQKTRLRDDEPIRLYAASSVLVCGLLFFGDVELVATLFSLFFLVTYACINYCVFTWDVSNLPGWRPTFRYHNGYFSLFMTVVCLAFMLLINWQLGLMTLAASLFIYMFVENVNSRHKESYNSDNIGTWGTLQYAKMYNETRKVVLKNQFFKANHPKNLRPSFLIVNKNFYSQSQFLDQDKETKNQFLNDMHIFKLCQALNSITKSLIVQGNIIIDDRKLNDNSQQNIVVQSIGDKFTHNMTSDMKNACVMQNCFASNFEEGYKYMIQLCGIGSLKPNIVFMKAEIDKNSDVWLSNFKQALASGLGVIMVENNFHYQHTVQSVSVQYKHFKNTFRKSQSVYERLNSFAPMHNLNKVHKVENRKTHEIIGIRPCIDVWWFYDDGGLTLLAAHLLRKDTAFEQCHLRILVFDNEDDQMTHFIQDLRIDAEIVQIQPSNEETEQLKALRKQFKNSQKRAFKAAKAAKKLQNNVNKRNSENDNNNNNSKSKNKNPPQADALGVNQDNARAQQPSKSVSGTQDIAIVVKDDQKNDKNKQSQENKASENNNNAKDKFDTVLLDDQLETELKTYKIIGNMIQKENDSNETKICVITLPFPRQRYSADHYRKLVRYLVPKSDENKTTTLLVRGNQQQLLTSAF